jgi:hypothetical protein
VIEASGLSGDGVFLSLVGERKEVRGKKTDDVG